MNKQQFNKTIEAVINSPRSNLQMINVLQNAFALYVKEETDRIVAELTAIRNDGQHGCSNVDAAKCDEYIDCDHCLLDRVIEIVRKGGAE